MASTYSPLKIELITTGEQTSTWGATTNVNLGTAIEEAIVGSADVTFSSADVTLVLSNTNGSQTARNLRLCLTGTTGGARNLIVPAIEKLYIVQNDTANTVTIKNSTGTGVAIPSSVSAVVYNDGVNITSASTYSTSLLTPLLAATDVTFVNALPVTSGGTGVTTSTGTGSVVRATSPTLVTPLLGTPTSGVLTNATGLPLTTGVTGTLGVSNGGTGVTTSTGSGANVLSTSPTLVTPLLGTPTSGVLTNCTGLPLSTGISGTLGVSNGGTGVTTSTGSGSNVLSTSPTLVTPILGTPTSGVLTNCTGTAAGLTAGTVTTNANLTGEVTSVGNAATVPNATVIGKVLTGYVSGAGTVAATDTILQAIQKLNGNDATNANLTGPITSVGNATSVASQTGTGSTFVMNTSPTLVTPLLGTPTSGALTNCTGLPLSTGITGTLGVSNGGTGVTTSTGSGANVLATSPTLVTPILGTPTSGTLTNCTGTASGLTAGAVTNGVYTTGDQTIGGIKTFSSNIVGNLTGNVTGNTSGTAANVTGTVAVANGGTGLTTLTANNVILGNGTSAPSFVAPSTSGNVLTSNGTTWTSAQLNRLTSDTAKASTSGTTVDFTGIPNWVKRITVMFDGVSTNVNGVYIIQLGDSGGFETTGYLGCASSLGTSTTNGSASSTAGVTINRDARAADTYAGICTITNISGNAWIISSMLYDLNASNPTTQVGGGNKSTSATLDRIRITTVNGDTFDAGSINIMYE